MWRWMPLLLVVATTGCTSAQLRCNLVQQTSSLTRLQHQVILDNLAAFSCNPDAVPFQMNLRTGATQVINSGNIVGPWLAAAQAYSASIALTHTAVDQWLSSPVTEETTLRLMRIAYRRSLGSAEDLYTFDFANRLAHRIKTQIQPGPDVTLEDAHMFARGPALPQLLDRAGWKGETVHGFPSEDLAVQLWRKDTSDIIASNSERIIQKGEVLTDETLVVTPVVTAIPVPAGASQQALAEAEAKMQPDGMQVSFKQEKGPRVLVATPYAAEIRRAVLSINEYLVEINPGWVHVAARKRDIPKCACYTGHYRGCGCEAYVWIAPQDREQFEEFTLKILRLSTLIFDPYGAQGQFGVMYSPPVAR